jgi:hypothetical protein
MNYIFQKRNHNSYQCGAYSIYNLLVNRKSNRKSNIKLNDIIRSCKATKENGTLVNNFNETLEKFNIHLYAKQDVTIQAIKDINKPIIILFHWFEYANEGTHYALIDEFYKDDYGAYKFRVINYSFDKPIHIITERELKSMLLPYEIDNCKMPTIWY